MLHTGFHHPPARFAADSSSCHDASADLQYCSMIKSKTKKRISRRKFLQGTGAAIAAATAAPTLEAQSPQPVADAIPKTTIRLTLNGAERRIEVEDRWTLVELLRDHLGL